MYLTVSLKSCWCSSSVGQMQDLLVKLPCLCYFLFKVSSLSGTLNEQTTDSQKPNTNPIRTICGLFMREKH